MTSREVLRNSACPSTSTSRFASKRCARSRTNWDLIRPARRYQPQCPKVLQRDRLQVSGNASIPMKLGCDLLLQRLCRAWLAVHQPDLARRHRKASHPAQQLSIIRVSAQVLHRLDVGANYHHLAIHFYGPGTRLQDLAARARSLKSLEQDRVPGIRQATHEVMQHAAAGGHTARRNDDHGFGGVVKRLGIAYRAVEVDAGG